MSKIGFIGMGNMGYAIMSGLLTGRPKKDLVFSCKRKEHASEVKKATGVLPAADNKTCAKESDILILAVKPQIYDAVLKEIAPEMNKKKIIVSLAPGITIADLKKKLGEETKIARIMPNTPALVKEGMTGIAYSDRDFTAAEQKQLTEIFSSFGRVKKVDEKLMDVVTLVSGSSPAFVYMFIDALADAGVKYGLSRKDAVEMASQAVLGSAKMVLETGEHPAALQNKVCSPGGTTIEGVEVLESLGFKGSLMQACDAVFKKCRGM